MRPRSGLDLIVNLKAAKALGLTEASAKITIASGISGIRSPDDLEPPQGNGLCGGSVTGCSRVAAFFRIGFRHVETASSVSSAPRPHAMRRPFRAGSRNLVIVSQYQSTKLMTPNSASCE